MIAVAASTLGACGKKKNKDVPPPAVPVHPNLPPPPPPMDPGNTQGDGLYPYCGAISQDYINPYSVPGTWHFDYQYNVNWFLTGGIATYWYGGYYWFYGDCASVSYVFTSNNLNYNYNWMVMNPNPCMTCVCYHCGAQPNPGPMPQPQPQPKPNPKPSSGCGSVRVSYQKTHSIEQMLGKNDSSASDTFTVPETQDYYIEVYGLYTGVTQKGETMTLTLNNGSSRAIPDLNDQTNVNAPQNTCIGKCHLKVCLSKGTHTIRFKGTNQSLWLKTYTIRTSKPSTQSCN